VAEEAEAVDSREGSRGRLVTYLSIRKASLSCLSIVCLVRCPMTE